MQCAKTNQLKLENSRQSYRQTDPRRCYGTTPPPEKSPWRIYSGEISPPTENLYGPLL